MRNISFSLTTRQIRERTKTVTRRIGWLNLEKGEHLMACEKCMGRKPGEPLVRLGEIEVISVKRQPLFCIDHSEVIKEGFPEMTVAEFINFFCDSHGRDCSPSTEVTRIEFRYVEPRTTK